MHCHLVSCIKDFGPFHSFWLFPFERYNGVLGSQPNNNRSIELQLMRRFQRDNTHLHMIESWPFSDTFLELIPSSTLSGSNCMCNQSEDNQAHPDLKVHFVHFLET